MPTEPPPSIWNIPKPSAVDDTDAIAIGADLEPGTILASYRAGVFPMPSDGELVWWSPIERAVLPLDGLMISRSLRKSMEKYKTTINRCFDLVIGQCADPLRPGFWITPEIAEAYKRLHQLGWAHSVETWNANDELVGGLYGVSIGGFFAGESMFHLATDASKVALARLVSELKSGDAKLLDVQWLTPHLQRMGAISLSRNEYLNQLAEAITLPRPTVFDT